MKRILFFILLIVQYLHFTANAQVAVGKEMKVIREEFSKQKEAELQSTSTADFFHYKFNNAFILSVICRGDKKGICTQQTVYLLPKFAPMVRQMMLSYGTKINDSLFVKSEKDIRYSMQFNSNDAVLVCKINLLSAKEFDEIIAKKPE